MVKEYASEEAQATFKKLAPFKFGPLDPDFLYRIRTPWFRDSAGNYLKGEKDL